MENLNLQNYGKFGPYPLNEGGTKFEHVSEKITMLKIAYGSRIDNFGWFDETGAFKSYGKTNVSNQIQFPLDTDDSLKGIRIWAGQAHWRKYSTVAALQFITHKGEHSPIYGKNNYYGEDAKFELICSVNEEICGFFGGHGSELDRLGVFTKKRM